MRGVLTWHHDMLLAVFAHTAVGVVFCLSYPVLPCLTLSYLALPCPALSYGCPRRALSSVGVLCSTACAPSTGEAPEEGSRSELSYLLFYLFYLVMLLVVWNQARCGARWIRESTSVSGRFIVC